MANSVSVIICCYNSVSRLSETLKYLAAQKANNIYWELIIVDNNSSDNTSAFAEEEWLKLGSPVPLIMVTEPEPGLSHARAAGIKQAQHELLLFCDDDNWLNDQYLYYACLLMLSNEKIGILGGLNTAVSSVKLPAWFKEFEQAYACGPQAEQDGEVSKDRLYVTGAGMVIRSAIFKKLEMVRFTSNLIDRKGEDLSSGGDAELCFMTAMLGYTIVYSSKLKLFHYMEPKRLTWDYFLKLSKGHAKSYYKLDFYKKIYEGQLISDNWLKSSATWFDELLSRDGILMFYHYYIKGNKAVGDKFNVYMISRAEMFKTHMHLRGEYHSFINEVYRLKDESIALVK
jgi:glycosyltransferase involved in cell wall biosynthesis